MPKTKYSQAKILEIVDLYINQKLSLRETAQRAHVKPETARRLITEAGYKIRSKNATRETNITKKQLERLYIKERKTVQEVAAALGVSNGTAGNYIKKFGLSRSVSQSNSISQGTQVWTDQDWLRAKKLLEEYKDYQKVADELGCSYWTLCDKNWKEWNIDLSENSTLFGAPQTYSGPNQKYQNKTLRSKAELEVARLLDSYNIDWKYEEPYIPGTKKKPDFYLPEHNIWIEYDGLADCRQDIPGGQNYNYKHPKIVAYRKAKSVFCLTNKSNYRDTIKALSILQNHNGSIKNLYAIKEIDRKECDSLLRPLHYLGKAPKGASIFMGLYIEGCLVGCATFGRGTNKHLSSSVGGNAYELTRFFTVDWLPKNSGSYFMSRIIKLIKKEYPDIEYLVSFADPEVKHTGGIYKAANWKYLGQNKKDYCYTINGERIHKSKFRCKDGKTEKELAKEAGAIKVKIQGKHKYVYALHTNKK